MGMQPRATYKGALTNLRMKRQKGQALLWFLGTLAASSGILFAVYNSGQVIAAKQKTVNAADAGALAGAATQARFLNTMAYGNRAIVANEVLIVQLVSLDSWVRYMNTGADNISKYTKLIPYVGPYISQTFKVVQQVSQGADVALKSLIPVVVKAEEVMKTALLGKGGIPGLHDAWHAGGAVFAYDIARQVVGHNKTDFNGRSDAAPSAPLEPLNNIAYATLNNSNWKNLTREYAAADRSRAADIILRSRDAFSGNSGRGGNWLTNFEVPLAAKLEKSGGTRLQGFQRWEAQDAWDLYTWDWKKWEWDDKAAVGWGRANLAANQTSGSKWGNSKAQKKAYSDPAKFGGWSGIPALYDIKNKTDKDPRVPFLFYVTKAEASTPTTKTLGVAKDLPGVLGSPNVDEKQVKNRVSALSKAEAYFIRPQRGVGDWTADAWAGGGTLLRSDSAKEYGSLYSPFWQARLAPTSEAEKMAAAAAAGQVVPPKTLQ